MAQYTWNEENRLINAVVNDDTTQFLYNSGGERTVKYGKYGETVYADKMYQVQTSVNPLIITKHIFVGDIRIVSKVSDTEDWNVSFERVSQYWYHGDHLQSSNYITDYEGKEYEFLLNTAYGETWAEESKDTLDRLNFKFTSKEEDKETGLYNFGKRYYSAQESKWASTDSALDDYLDTNAGEGGIYNPVNLSQYNYGGNNPVKYTDPNGEFIKEAIIIIGAIYLYNKYQNSNQSNNKITLSKTDPGDSGIVWKETCPYRRNIPDCAQYWGNQPFHIGTDWQVFDKNNNHISGITQFRAPADGKVYDFRNTYNTLYIYDAQYGGYWELSHGQDNSFKIDIQKTIKNSDNPTEVKKGDIIALMGNKGVGTNGRNIHLHLGFLFFNKQKAEEYVNKYGGEITEAFGVYYVPPPINYGKFMKEYEKK